MFFMRVPGESAPAEGVPTPGWERPPGDPNVMSDWEAVSSFGFIPEGVEVESDPDFDEFEHFFWG